MKKTFFSLAVALALAGPACAQWTVQVPESEFVTVSGGVTNTNLNAIANAGGGVFFVANNINGNAGAGPRNIMKVDTNQPPGSRVTLVTSDTLLAAAIGVANGAQADPAATAIRIQALGVNSNGKLIAFLDGSGMQSALLAIEPNSPFNISVLCCDSPTFPVSPIEGGNGMVMAGNTAYLLCDGGFGNPDGDCIKSVDTSTLVNDGSKAATLAVTEATLLAATGDTAANDSINDMKLLSGNNYVAINSGATGSNDNVITVNPVAGTASLLVNATDLEADLGSTDVGYNSVAVDGAGRVWLANMFGTPSNASGDDGVLILSNIVPPNASTALESEGKIFANAGGTDAFIGADGMVYDSVTNRVYVASDGTGNSGLMYIVASTADVPDWTLY